MQFTKAEREAHLLALAQACIRMLEVDHDFGVGLTMDCKRPFGNSGGGALIDTLDVVDVKYDHDNEDECEDARDYAQHLWLTLPRFLRDRCRLELKP